MVTVEKRGNLQEGISSDTVRGDIERRSQRLPDHLRSFAQKLYGARLSLRDGDETGWKKFVKDSGVQEMARKFREIPEGREIMNIIYRAFPIEEAGAQPVTESALVVHGEVDIGELDNQEGIVIKN